MSKHQKVVSFYSYQIEKDREKSKLHSKVEREDSKLLFERLAYSNHQSVKKYEDEFRDILKIENLEFNNDLISKDNVYNSVREAAAKVKMLNRKEAADMSDINDKFQFQKEVFEAKMEAQESRLSSQVSQLEAKINTSTSEISSKIDNAVRDLNSNVNNIRVELIKAQQEGIDKIRAERKEDHKYILGSSIGIAGLVIAALSIILPLILN